MRRANEDLGRFADLLAHELRAPLLLALAELDEFEAGQDGRDGHGTAMVRASLRRRLRSIDDQVSTLAALARLGRTGGEPGVVELDEVLEEVRSLLLPMIEACDGEIGSGALPSVLGDRPMLVMLVRNLVQNALRAAGPERPHVTVSAREAGREHQVTVADEGSGIDADAAWRAFTLLEPFRLGGRGSGIGLVLCGRIVAVHGGRIWAERRPEGGTAVHFTLPAAGQPG